MKSFFTCSRIGSTVLALSLLVGCATTTERVHPDFARRERATERLLVLPMDVKIMQVGFTGDNARIPAREAAVTADLARLVPALLTQRGHSTQLLDLDAVTDAPDLRFVTEQVRTAYESVSKQLYEQINLPEDKRASIRASLGPVVNRLADYADADALVLVRGNGFEKTRGMIAKDVVAATLLATLTGQALVQPTSGLVTEVALVDGTTGDVLWTNIGFANADTENLTALLKTFPLPHARRALVASTASAVKPVPDAPVAQVVADVPALVPARTPSTTTARPAPSAPQPARPVVTLAAAASVQPVAAKPPTPAMIIALAIDQDSRDWQPRLRDASAAGALIELVPAGQDSKAWSEMVALHTIFSAHPVADLVASWTAELAAKDPQATLAQTTAADGSITLSYESPALHEKGIRRFMSGSDGVYMVAYHARPQTYDQGAYSLWSTIVAGASLEAND